MQQFKAQQGFTLIEVIIVIVIIAFAMLGVSMGFGATSRVKLRSSCWLLIAASRTAYSTAVTQGNTVRLAMDFDKKSIQIQETRGRVVLNRDDETGSGMHREGFDDEWGADGGIVNESFSGRMKNIGPNLGMSSNNSTNGATGTDDMMGNMMMGISNGHLSDPFLASMQQGAQFGAVANKAVRYRGPRFTPVEGKRGKVRKLKGDSNFLKIFSPHAPQAIEQGKAFLYFFPGGFTEHTFIQMYDGKDDDPRIYTVEIHPLNGRAFVHHEELEPEDDLDNYQEVAE